MMIYYIQNQDFITTDTEIVNGVGITLQDYYQGKYIKLNDDQIAFMNQNPSASPLEVFLMKHTAGNENIPTPSTEAYSWFNENIMIARINGNDYPWFDWRFPLMDINLFRELGETEFTLQIENDQYRGDLETIRTFLLNYGRYYIKSKLLMDAYLKEIYEHPERDVDYTVGFLEVPSISGLERIA